MVMGVLSSCERASFSRGCFSGLRVLGGSWDLVTRVIIKVTVLTTTYNHT